MKPIQLDNGWYNKMELKGTVNTAVLRQNIADQINVIYKHHGNFNTRDGGYGGNMITNTMYQQSMRTMNQGSNLVDQILTKFNNNLVDRLHSSNPLPFDPMHNLSNFANNLSFGNNMGTGIPNNGW